MAYRTGGGFGGGGAWKTLGQGLRGIGRGIADRRREDEEKERQAMLDAERQEDRRLQREQMKRQNEAQDLQTELSVIERGGGVGPIPEPVDVPTEPRPIVGTTELPEFSPDTSLVPEPVNEPAGLTEEIMPAAPEYARREGPIMIDPPDAPAGAGREYREVAGGEYYIEDPEARARRLEEEEWERTHRRQTRERDARADRLGGPLHAYTQGEAGPEEYGDLVAGGVNPDRLIAPPERPFNPDTDPLIQRFEHFRPHGMGPTGAALPGLRGGSLFGGRGGAEANTQQLQAARNLTTAVQGVRYRVAAGEIPEDRGEAMVSALIDNSPFTPEEATQIIRSGRMPAGDPLPGMGGASGWELPGTGLPEPIQAGPTSPVEVAPGVDTAGASAPLTDNEVSEARQMLSSVPRGQWETILREEGATDEQIQRIIGGG